MNRHAGIGMALLGTGAASAAGFAVLATRVAARKTSHADGQARKRFPKRRRPLTKTLVAAIGPIGKEWIHAPIALTAAAYVWRRGRAGTPAAIPILLSSAASTVTGRLFERYLRQRKPPAGRHSPTEPSFPSGHSLETTAVSLVVAYVLVREGVADARIAVPLALAIPIASGAGRLYLDRHWATDVLGGWLAGASVAAGCTALYELSAGESPASPALRPRTRR